MTRHPRAQTNISAATRRQQISKSIPPTAQPRPATDATKAQPPYGARMTRRKRRDTAGGSTRTHTVRGRGLQAAIVAISAVAITGCGTTQAPETGQLVTGPNIRSTQPPWPPQYAGLAQRIKTLGLPTGDSEKFHIHAQLSVFNEGLLVSVPANIGIDERHHVGSTIHTHDRTGIIHMEGPRPYSYTLADLFTIWGVRFGAGTLGALQSNGAKRVWVYAKGKPIRDPARHILTNGDVISIGYGTRDSFPHKPGTYLLKQEMSGKGNGSCAGGPVKKQKSCLSTKRP